MTKPEVILFNGVSMDGKLDNRVDMGLYYGLAGSWNADGGGGSGRAAEAFFGTENSPANPISLNLVHCETFGEDAVWLRYSVSAA